MTRCLAPDCQMGGLGCDNMTVVLVCFVNGKPYEELSARCSISPHSNVKNGLNSEGGSPSSSCSSSTAETPEEETFLVEEGANDEPDDPSKLTSKQLEAAATEEEGLAIA